MGTRAGTIDRRGRRLFFSKKGRAKTFFSTRRGEDFFRQIFSKTPPKYPVNFTSPLAGKYPCPKSWKNLTHFGQKKKFRRMVSWFYILITANSWKVEKDREQLMSRIFSWFCFQAHFSRRGDFCPQPTKIGVTKGSTKIQNRIKFFLPYLFWKKKL